MIRSISVPEGTQLVAPSILIPLLLHPHLRNVSVRPTFAKRKQRIGSPSLFLVSFTFTAVHTPLCVFFVLFDAPLSCTVSLLTLEQQEQQVSGTSGTSKHK